MPCLPTCGRSRPPNNAVHDNPAGVRLSDTFPARLVQAYGLTQCHLIYYGIPWRARRLQRFYAQFLRAGDLCLDIGAHLGNRLRALASLGARVAALEPNPVLRLLGLGRYKFNWTIGETTRLQSPAWMSSSEMIRHLKDLPADPRSGDIYARLG